MNRFQKRKVAIEKSIRGEIDAYKAIYKKADDDDRDPTDEERLEIESHLKAIEVLGEEKKGVEENIKTLDHVDDIGRELGPAVSPTDMQVKHNGEPVDRLAQRMAKTLGESFVDSAGFKSAVDAYRESGRLPSNFSTGAIALDMKGTLLEGSGSPGSGSGGGLLTTPQVIPGVVETLFQRLTVADLFLGGQVAGNTVRYVVEGTATSGAAGVAEAGLKPESTLGLGTRDEPVKKIATILPIAEEMLEDAPMIQSYINGRLSLFVKIEEERQLVRGTSGGNEVQGLLTSRSVPVYAGGTAAGNRAEQLFKAMNGMRGSAFVEPDWVVLNPADWEIIRLLKDTANQYYGGGPFQGPYGSGANFSASGQATGSSDAIWNKLVYVTAATGAGTAIVGSQSSAQVFRRGGISVEATNSHSDYFQRNLVAIRAEERLALAVYRPAGFVEVRLS